MSAMMHIRTRGFTLVEMLVTLVVLGVGMLGIAGLYVTSLRSGSGSIYRMQAVNVASDLADRIRANRTANVSYAAGAADNNCVGVAANCSANQMAANDLFVWQQQIAATLPGSATGKVNVVLDPGGLVYTYQIIVSWLEPGQTAVSSYTMNFQL